MEGVLHERKEKIGKMYENYPAGAVGRPQVMAYWYDLDIVEY
jgi:hypothetical protein